MGQIFNATNATSSETASTTAEEKKDADYLASITQELTKRNWVFIDDLLQEKIGKTSILFAGCGLGSAIATTAARTGFLKYVLADGDSVELSNLNRQAFSTDDLGKNKAFATCAILQGINPMVRPKVISSFIDIADIHEDLLNDCDYVINTIDMGETYFELIDEVCEQGKTVLLPLNVGFGGCLMVCNQSSERIRNIVDVANIKNDRDFFYELCCNLDISRLPKYIQSNVESIFQSIDNTGSNPQLGIAANITASLTITTIIRLLAGQPVPLAPDFITVDAFEPH